VLARFTLMNRLLLAMAFLPTGLVKATGQRFTLLPLDNPVGFFFEAMYRTGPWWVFIGVLQVGAAIVLLPATATVGALLVLPIAVSILLITWGVGFGNTVLIAAGMVLSATYLVYWDGDRVWDAAARLVGPRAGPPLLAGVTRVERAGWVLGAGCGIALFLTTRGFLPTTLRPGLFVAGLAGAGLVLAGWLVGAWRRPA
jgi:hypothetical protein